MYTNNADNEFGCLTNSGLRMELNKKKPDLDVKKKPDPGSIL